LAFNLKLGDSLESQHASAVESPRIKLNRVHRGRVHRCSANMFKHFHARPFMLDSCEPEMINLFVSVVLLSLLASSVWWYTGIQVVC